MPGERYDAYNDLGGQTHQLSEGEEDALVRLGLGSKEMRARFERRNAEQQNSRQDAINHAGAEAIRQADIRRDAAKGIDVNSVEYLAKQRLAADRRNRRY